MSIVASILLLALTRAEIIERMRAPVITQAEGLVQVYADCPEDMRREYQMPIASFASETVKTLYKSLGKRSIRFQRAGIMIHVGDVRTNLTTVMARVATNNSRVISRIYVKSPGYADLNRLRLEVVKGFCRSVEAREVSDDEAMELYVLADPAVRIARERERLEKWLNGDGGAATDEDGLRLMRKIFEPGRASKRDVLIFASRLFLYPPEYDLRFMRRFDCLGFREAFKHARHDPLVRIMAIRKADDLPLFGGGRGAELYAAALAYREFLLELGKDEKPESELLALLDDADEKLNLAYEKAQ